MKIGDPRLPPSTLPAVKQGGASPKEAPKEPKGGLAAPRDQFERAGGGDRIASFAGLARRDSPTAQGVQGAELREGRVVDRKADEAAEAAAKAKEAEERAATMNVVQVLLSEVLVATAGVLAAFTFGAGAGLVVLAVATSGAGIGLATVGGGAAAAGAALDPAVAQEARKGGRAAGDSSEVAAALGPSMGAGGTIEKATEEARKAVAAAQP